MAPPSYYDIAAIRDDRTRRVSISTLLIAAIICTPFAIKAYSLGIHLRFYGLILVVISCPMVALYLFNKGSLRFGGILGIIIISVGVSVIIYTNGGITNVTSAWIITIPIIGGLMSGLSGGITGFVLALVIGSGLLTLDVLGLQPASLTPAHMIYNQERSTQFAQLLSISIALIFYFRNVHSTENALFDSLEQLNQEVENRAVAEQQAEQASLAKSDFLANMSHEIRTPMNGIYGTLQLLSNQPLNDQSKRMTQIGLTSARDLLVIINDILDFSKIEAGKLELEKRPFSLHEIIDAALSDLTPMAKQKELAVELNINPDCHDFWIGDPTRIKQVLINLISNAIKFTSEGGVVVTACQQVIDGTESLLITVEDTGIGLNQASIDQLFTRFQQADQSITRKYGGTGLGLVITQSLINIMGGSINLTSVEGEGSLFKVALPLERSDSYATNNINIEVDAPDLTGKNILIAEDNLINQEVISSLLAPCNATIEIVENGALAVERALESDPDLVLMDIQMPVLDGVSACLKLREHGKGFAIIALTANVMSDEVSKYHAAGFTDHIAKPIEIAKLYSVITHAFEYS